MATKKETAETKGVTIEVRKVDKETITALVRGNTPFVCNAMNAKVMRDLLDPPPKKTKAEQELTIKHDPVEEYRRSAYRSMENDGPTRILFPAAGFKKAMASAALELPGVKKAQIGRLCWVEGVMVPIYGIPQMWMTVTRMANPAKTPDVRTRAIIPEWAAIIRVSFVKPNLRRTPVMNLLASAGVFIGVGDGRPEKGAMTFGQFETVKDSDEAHRRIVETGGREAQDNALENPTFFDQETADLFGWWKENTKERREDG